MREREKAMQVKQNVSESSLKIDPVYYTLCFSWPSFLITYDKKHTHKVHLLTSGNIVTSL